jgi:hypothetical protein
LYTETTPEAFMKKRTYQGSGADADGGGALADGAVGGSDNGISVDEGATAEVRATAGQGDDVGELASSGSGSTDDEGTVLMDGRESLLDTLRVEGLSHDREQESCESEDGLHFDRMGKVSEEGATARLACWERVVNVRGG